MKITATLFLVVVFFLSSLSSPAQRWATMMHNPDADFYEIQREFNSYWLQPDKKQALNKLQLARLQKRSLTSAERADLAGWKQFKRWEAMKEPRVYPSGKLYPPSDYPATLQKIKEEKALAAGNWSFIGVTGTPSNVLPYSGAGRINCIRFDPSNANTVYAGAPSGGVWKSTDGGTNWTLWNTDMLGALGISDIAIHPVNSQIIYLASGDRDGGATNGIGVIKSMDGGLTWTPTGLSLNASQGITVSRLLIDPANPQIIHAGTTGGIYRSANGGTTFTLVAPSVSVRDMEMKPGDPTVIYASTMTEIYKSVNSGQSYTSAYTVSGAGGLEMAVTEANAAYLYVLAADAGTYGMKGVYRSTNGASTFALRASTPNLMGYDCSGNDNAGQGWYDMAIAASPTNAETIFTGGIFIWKSTNGGTSWTLKGDGMGCSDYVFWDIHELAFVPGSGSQIYAGCDGGVFKSQNTGGSWGPLNTGFSITQHYTLGQSATNASMIITSCQDVGTDLRTGTNWIRTQSGEATEVFIDRTNNNIMYGGGYNGRFARSTDGGNNWDDIVTGLTGNGAWVTPWMQDVASANTLWAGYQEIFKSVNKGTNWTQVSSLGGTQSFKAIDQSPSNSQVIYAARPASIIKSADGGSTWTTVTGNLPVGNAQITYIEIDPVNANHVWVTFSGYSAGNKVWMTTNGGTSWTNYSDGLPNLPANCIVFEKNSNNGTLYAGMDVGVYYRDSLMPSWVSFSAGLPNVIVNELEIQYTAGKIRAATYGRGIWESDLQVTTLQNLDAAVMNIISPPSAVCDSVISPVVKIRNAGLNMLTTIDIKYKVDAQPLQTFTWTGSLASLAVVDVQLPSYPVAGTGSHTLTAYTSNPNSSTDQNTINDTVNFVFSVISPAAGIQPPVQQGFVSAAFPPSGWQLENNSSLWSKNTSTGGYGLSSNSAKADFYNTPTGTDAIISPGINFQNLLPPIRLYFDYAYATYDANYSDSLTIDLFDECTMAAQQIYSKGGSSLYTAPPVTSPFVPSAGQWKTDTINLDTMAGKGTVQIRFQAISGYGNALYLDNINLTAGGVGIFSQNKNEGVMVYPNPSDGKITIHCSGEIKNIGIYSLPGKRVILPVQKNESNLNYIDLSVFPDGVYFIEITSAEQTIVRKVVLQRKRN